MKTDRRGLIKAFSIFPFLSSGEKKETINHLNESLESERFLDLDEKLPDTYPGTIACSGSLIRCSG